MLVFDRYAKPTANTAFARRGCGLYILSFVDVDVALVLLAVAVVESQCS